MADADLGRDLLNLVTQFVEQHGRPNTPMERALETFTEILHRFNGKMHIRHLPSLGLDRPLDWIREHPDRFHIFEDDNGHALIVGIVVRGVRVCTDYNGRRGMLGCHTLDCQAFHVCRDHVGGWCRAGQGCRRSHSFNDSHNQRLIQWFRLDGFSDDDMFRILAMSAPQVCSDYNHNGCGLVHACTRVHVCRNYIARRCENVECDRAHDFLSAHSRRLLHMYRLNALDFECVRRSLLFYRVNQHRMALPHLNDDMRALAALFGGLNKDGDELALDEPRRKERRDIAAQRHPGDSGHDSKPEDVLDDHDNEESSRDAETDSPVRPGSVVVGNLQTTMVRPKLPRFSAQPPGKKRRPDTADVHIHPGASEKTYICEENIRGACPFRSRCSCHHYPQPFVWQVNVFDGWVTLDRVNEVIESTFCDPNVDEVLVEVRFYSLLDCLFVTICKGKK